jgi:hypothetical protein
VSAALQAVLVVALLVAFGIGVVLMALTFGPAIDDDEWGP